MMMMMMLMILANQMNSEQSRQPIGGSSKTTPIQQPQYTTSRTSQQGIHELSPPKWGGRWSLHELLDQFWLSSDELMTIKGQ